MPENGGALVAGFDGSAESVKAIGWAAAEARLRDRRLLIVQALNLPQPAPEGYGGYPAGELGDEMRLRPLRERLAEVAADCRRDLPEPAISTRLRHGDPASVLAEAAREADAELVAIGSSGHGALPRMLLGSTATELAHTIRLPLVVIRGAPPADAPVVVGVDESQASQDALRFAFRYAELHGCPLHAAHAWSDQPVDHLEPISRWTKDADAERAAIDEFTRKYVAPWCARHPGVSARITCVENHPARMLLELAENARLVVVGSHGHGALHRAVLGSVSHAVLHHAACPVAVLRGSETPAG